MTITLFFCMPFGVYKHMLSTTIHLQKLKTNPRFLLSICMIFKINQEVESWKAGRECLLQLKTLTCKFVTW